MTLTLIYLRRIAFLLFLIAPAAITAGDRSAAIEQERAKVRAEMTATRFKYPALDEHMEQVAAHIGQHPFLSFEQAYCVVVRGLREEPACRDVLLNLAISLALPLVPPEGVPVLEELDDGSYQVLVGKDMLPVFEREELQPESKTPRLREVYGPGIYQDATGRPFGFFTREGEQAPGPVKLNGYGLGVHMDQYGRPVHAIPQR